MRYCRRFLAGIPHLKVDCPRVTHPSATLFLRRAFDLHVLGTPPAFILSQDQTRHPTIYISTAQNLSCKKAWLTLDHGQVMNITLAIIWQIVVVVTFSHTRCDKAPELTGTGTYFLVQLLFCFPLFSCQGAGRNCCFACVKRFIVCSLQLL